MRNRNRGKLKQNDSDTENEMEKIVTHLFFLFFLKKGRMLGLGALRECWLLHMSFVSCSSSSISAVKHSATYLARERHGDRATCIFVVDNSARVWSRDPARLILHV